MESALATFERLKQSWKAAKYDECVRLLAEMKIALTRIGFLQGAGATSTKELLIAREALEYGARCSIKVADPVAFERYMAQLKPYYFDFKAKLPESAYMHELLGLNLLCLLSQNRIGEFHTELERIDPALLHDNIYIRHPVALEQYLMEGAYNKVFLSRANIPAENYAFFVEILLDTIRKEIADCCQNAYASLSVADAAKLTYCDNEKAFAALAAQYPLWKFKGGNVVFPPKEAVKAELAAPTLIEHSLGYALQLERII